MTEVDIKNRKRRISKEDWSRIADFIVEEHERRKRNRRDLEKHWDEIDRQVAMEPSNPRKLLSSGQPDPKKRWMSEVEPPFQAQTLEVLTADARRMMAPDSGPWFAAHAAMTDEYLRRADFQSFVAGDENEVPSRINQDNADKLVEGFLVAQMNQYDFWGNLDQINAEAFKYGVGIGRARLASKSVYINTSRGVVRDRREIPVLVPRSIRHTYLDDSTHNLMNEGQVVGPAAIFETDRRLVDLIEAANRGSNDPDNPNGGWMPANIKGLDGGEDGIVKMVEYEGDLIVPRKTVDSIFVPGAIVTVVIGQSDGKQARRVVRFRFRQYPFTSYIEFPYHHETQKDVYPTSPLMKGRPIQLAVADALSRLMDVAALNAAPPLKYDRSDPWYAQHGGPVVHPDALWASLGETEPVQIGDPNAMLAIYQFLVAQYYDVTGVNQPRLGAQTLSHTTAYAKEAELSRGVVRTVDYVRSSLKGPLTRWLSMAYEMGKKFRGEQMFYIEPYGGFVEIKPAHLPDMAHFDVFGSGGPEEKAQKTQMRFQAAMQAVNLETLKVQLGNQPSLDIEALQKQLMREGGWTDLDAVFRTEPATPGPAGGPPMGASPQGGPGAAVAALQGLRQ